MNEKIVKLKALYKQILESTNRKGVSEFLEWLEGTDFYTAPCSTRYHLSKEGGLLEHSLNVHYVLMNNVNASHRQRKIDRDSIVICALTHDICKADFYGVQMRNVKENGVWVQKPFYVVEDKMPYGHGEKSVLLLQRFIELKAEEVMAIRWHMGGFTEGVSSYGMGTALSNAMNFHPLVPLLHMADMESTYMCENDGIDKLC